jgi:lipopolysaccharide transport system ATP-binding protein
MTTSAIAITCQGVSKRFALVDGGSAWRLAIGAGKDIPIYQALHNVSFEVPKGQFVGVLGRNGAGKSTLLRVVGGVYAADTGRVAVNGAMSAIYELGLVGNPELTGRAYAQRLLTVHGFSARERAVMIADIHSFSELGDRFEDPVLTYSAGMTARLFFATATAGSYEVYLLDEILSVGDQHFQAKCWRRLRERIARGASGVLVTHDWSAVVKMCETAHVLDRGKITFSGPAERAARLYLFGEAAGFSYHAGVARLGSQPSPIRTRPGELLSFAFDVDIMRPAKVGCVAVIERLQPGYGWETALMSRSPNDVGSEPGRYTVTIELPNLPLDPGAYQIGVNLTIPDAEKGDPYVTLLDGWSWLNGNGLALEVDGNRDVGLNLPLRWNVGPGSGKGIAA